MNRRIFLLIFGMFVFAYAYAQTDSEPTGLLKSRLKKENGKLGVLNPAEKEYNDWWVKPEYDKVTAINFEETKDPLYFKFWKGSTFDLVRYFPNSKSPNYRYAVIVKDVSEVEIKDKNLVEFYTKYSFFTYKANGKWGCFVYWDADSRDNSYDTKVVAPEYDKPPILFTDSHFQEYDLKKYFIVVQSGGLLGLLDYDGYQKQPLGMYCDPSIASTQLSIVDGPNNLKGYTIGTGISVAPKYTSIKEIPSKDPHTPSLIECTLPNDSIEVRQGLLLVSKREYDATRIARIERVKNAEIARNDSILNRVTRKTAFGNMELAIKGDGTGTIVSIGGKVVNTVFSAHQFWGLGDVGTFTLADKKTVMYYESQNKAVKCNYGLPKDQKVLDIHKAGLPWPGEENPVPEIFADSANVPVVVNAVNGKRITLPYKLRKGQLIYNEKPYRLLFFINHADIVFTRKDTAFDPCISCSGTGYTMHTRTVTVPGEIKVTTKTVTVYKDNYNWIKERHESTPTTETQKIETKMPDTYKEETVKTICEPCAGKGGKPEYSDVFLDWDGKQLVLRKK